MKTASWSRSTATYITSRFERVKYDASADADVVRKVIRRALDARNEQ
jgi:hypothetical protein